MGKRRSVGKGFDSLLWRVAKRLICVIAIAAALDILLQVFGWPPICFNIFKFVGMLLYVAFMNGRVAIVGGLLCSAILLCVLFIILYICSWPVLGIVSGVSKAVKQNQKSKTTYIAVQDIDYYREEFENVSPGLISVLYDMDVEANKDVIATLLSLQLKGYVDIQGDDILIKTGSEKLTDSESLLLAHIRSCGSLEGLPTGAWKNAIYQEGVRAGYLKTNKDKGYLIKQVVICVISCILAFSVLPRVYSSFDADDVDAAYDTLMSDPDVGHIVEYFESLEDDTQITNEMLLQAGIVPPIDIGDKMEVSEGLTILFSYPATQEFLLSIAGIFLVLLVSVFLMFFAISTPFRLVGVVIGYFVSRPKYKRTKAGMALTEQIVGMKRFIHDYSILSEADKQRLAVWDYFLVYAVVLEENTGIVKEIGSYRNLNIYGLG